MPKTLKYKGCIYVQADIPGRSLKWEKGKNIDKSEREKVEKINLSEDEAKRTTKALIDQIGSQFVNLQNELKTAEDSLKKVEDSIKAASKSRIVKRLSKLPSKDNEPNFLEILTLLSDNLIRPGKDGLANMNRMLKELREKHGGSYGDEQTPSPEFRKFLSDLLSL